MDMHMNKKKIINLLGTFFIIVGGLQLILYASDIWWSLVFLFQPVSSMSLQEYLLWSAASLLLYVILPLASFIAGFGILKIKKWGWWLALASCIITFIINFYGTINYAITSSKFRNMPMPEIPEGYNVIYISMWPTYIYTISSALLIILLTRKLIKDAVKP
jgi:hypothetical protein